MFGSAIAHTPNPSGLLTPTNQIAKLAWKPTENSGSRKKYIYLTYPNHQIHLVSHSCNVSFMMYTRLNGFTNKYIVLCPAERPISRDARRSWAVRHPSRFFSNKATAFSAICSCWECCDFFVMFIPHVFFNIVFQHHFLMLFLGVAPMNISFRMFFRCAMVFLLTT